MTAEDIRKAEELIIKLHQNQNSEVIASQTQRKLNIVKDRNGIWRCYGRLGKSHLSEDAKNPIFVAPDSGLARLIIQEAHGKLHYIGLDLFGPVKTRNAEGIQTKPYGCIVTCATTRLMHIEFDG
ncbi:unnamed protein product [Strongylus vulgaris]|uniref:Uncharacterized protein n=1 Tax=Strongylus vulgaris TaxID=40348 RepID=A0A3P7JE44_STRVU|nr:unnamed protein product [Strongylus vulgaris]